MADEHRPFRPAVLAPTHNNDRTLADVLKALDSLNLPIIIVNDGATDATAGILQSWSDDRNRIVLTHPANLGKAAALRTGFSAAGARGFTHAITIDTDGQHDIADVPPLLNLARQRPDALILGARPIEDHPYPLASRIGRAVSNLLIRLESGACVADSQCGLRVYPLNILTQISSSAGRYGFETEIITRGAWAGVPIGEVPIRCIYEVAGGRVSHFRPVIDSLRAARMHAAR